MNFSRDSFLIKAVTFFGKLVGAFALMSLHGKLFGGGYSPQEITELQKIPLIIQGGTDMGGSNMFAFYTSGHIFYGVIACILFTIKYSSVNQRLRYCSELAIGVFIFTFVLANLFTSLWELLNFTYFPSSPFHIWCQYFQVLVIFSITSGLSFYLIKRLSKTSLNLPIRIFLSPIFFILMIWMCWTGITPKAGQVLMSNEIPQDLPNSQRHEALLKIHKCCLGALGY